MGLLVSAVLSAAFVRTTPATKQLMRDSERNCRKETIKQYLSNNWQYRKTLVRFSIEKHLDIHQDNVKMNFFEQFRVECKPGRLELVGLIDRSEIAS